MSGRTIIVCGGRHFNDERFVYDTLDRANRAVPIAHLRHGDCPTGLDRIAKEWARSRSIGAQGYPADWRTHGRAAGPIRNAEMANDGADRVFAFPGGNGTKSMCNIAKAAGIPVTFVAPNTGADGSTEGKGIDTF